MREIRFRGKRIDIGRWVEGSYLKMFHGLHMDGNHYIHFIVDTKGIRYEVYPEIIGQYTGLKDRSGKEIYEGDIVNWYLNDMCLTAPVYFDEEAACFWMGEEVSRKGSTVMNDWFRGEYEVIGNIYENPELLKGDENA